MGRRLLPVLGLVAGLGLACTEETRVSWRIDFEDPSLAERAAVIEVAIHEGTCDAPGPALFQHRYARADAVRPSIPAQDPGPYAFRATAIDAACRTFAASCDDVELKVGHDERLVSSLAAVREVPRCDQCVAGVCSEPDAGTPSPPPTGVPTPELVHPPLGLATCAERRPLFVWRAVAESIDHEPIARYEVALDAACAPGFPSCDPPAAPTFTVDPAVELIRFRPLDALDVATGPPVGRRYYWRVRACTEAACSDWSEARYLDVGRCPLDFDGDGFDDLVVGERKTGGALVHVFSGDASGVAATPSVTIGPRPASSAVSLASAGDVNADGYSDLIAGFPGENAAVVYLGGSSGIDPSARALPMIAPGDVSATLGASVAGAGDFDGDGFDDVVVGAPGASPPSRAFVFLGGSPPDGAHDVVLLEDAPGIELGAAVDGCDVDGDGRGDVVAGAPARGPSGEAQIFHGRPTPDGPLRALDLLSPGALGRDGDRFGAAVACGDLVPGADGLPDGYDDVVVGAPAGDGACGRVFVFQGGAPAADRRGVSPVPRDPVLSDDDCGGERFGSALAVVDGDRDGAVDLLVGEPGFVHMDRQVGGVVWYRQSAGTLVRMGRVREADGRRHLGTSLAGLHAGSDGTGEPRVAAGEPANGSSAGRVRIYRFGAALAETQSVLCPTSTQPGCGEALAR